MHRVLTPIPDPPPTHVDLSGEALHHAIHVLRLRAGDSLQLFDGRGRSYEARIESVTESSARVRLGAGQLAATERPVTVIQGLPKADKLEWVIEKCTELGVARICPVLTQRSVAKLPADRARERVRRWQRIANEAARQCGRSDVPEVTTPAGLVEAARALPTGTCLIVLDEEERSQPLSQAVAACPASTPIALVVGAEGGLSREEVGSLTALGARPASLGRRILRTETAALIALALVRHLDGQLG